jgi:hypothetical protein
MFALKQTSETYCDYYLELNTRCRSNKLLQSTESDISSGQNSLGGMDLSLIEDDDDDEMTNQLDNSIGSKPLPTWMNNMNDIINRFPDDFCTNVIRTNEYGWIASPNFYE